jgi:glucan 1,3-beta-glucosidase
VIIVPVYFTVIKPKNTSSQSNISSNGNNGNNTSPEAPPPDQPNGKTTGGDGSIVFTANGNFTYKNPFGGFWVYDPKDPFNNGAKAQVRTHGGPAPWHLLTPALNRQSWTPALNETWKWGRDTIEGEWKPRPPACAYPTLAFRRVNLGGWFVLEPFITPALFEKYLTSTTPAVDEYALSQMMRADGSINDLEKHYQTFIVSQPRAK